MPPLSSVFSSFNSYALGLPRDGSVVLEPHSHLWAEAFQFESKRLSDGLKRSDFVIHHIGSTSIPDISAKPVLDLLIEAPSIEAIDSLQSEFEKLGYTYKGEYGLKGRRYCVLYDSEKTKSYVHIHAYEFNDPAIERHLVFRDYLSAFPDAAKEYESTKKRVASDPAISRSNYTEAKAETITRLLEAALRWRKPH